MYIFEPGSIFISRYYPSSKHLNLKILRNQIIVSFLDYKFDKDLFRIFVNGEEVKNIHMYSGPLRFTEDSNIYEYVGNILGYSVEETLRLIKILSSRDNSEYEFAKDILMNNKKNMHKINANI